MRDQNAELRGLVPAYFLLGEVGFYEKLLVPSAPNRGRSGHPAKVR